MSVLNIGGRKIPDEAVTQTFAILGKRGSGKTTTARVLAEQLLGANLPVVVFDPTGAWWGLRSSADGKSDGFPVVIFGGEHADVPLDLAAGAMLADVVIDERIPAVFDLSRRPKTQMRRFATDFLERLYQRNRDPLHVIIDEADLFAPQRAGKDMMRLLGAMEDVVLRGRINGLGSTAITQRPARLNKDILSQIEALIVLRMIGKLDIEAINDWVVLHADEGDAARVKASLPSLPVGAAWLWSPGWLDILEQIQVQRPQTYDSSATPKAGERRVPVRSMAKVDLDALGERIAQTVEKAKETDPTHLRRRIAELERALAAARTEQPAPEPERVEVPVLSPEDRADIRRIADDLAAQLSTSVEQLANRIDTALAQAPTGVATPPATVTKKPLPPPAAPKPAPKPAPMIGVDVGDRKLSKAERAILNVLVQHGTRTGVQTALLAGYSHKASTFRNALGSLRSADYVTGYGDITATPAGAAALGDVDPLPTGAALREWWKSTHLGKAERAIVDVLAAAWPSELPTAELADRAEYSAVASTFRNALGRLRSLELVHGRGSVAISDTLMEE